jgi:hypothetical protein
MNQFFRTVLYNALCACFGLSPSSAEASVLIREAYQEPENAPRPPRNTDVIYYSLEPDTASEPPVMYAADNASAASHTPSVSSFSAWRLVVVCYGPHALENARKIRAFLYLDGSGYPRSILRKAGIYPVPDPPEPQLLHEPEGSLWRERADLMVFLRAEETQTHSNRRNAIRTAPAIEIHSIRGKTHTLLATTITEQ